MAIFGGPISKILPHLPGKHQWVILHLASRCTTEQKTLGVPKDRAGTVPRPCRDRAPSLGATCDMNTRVSNSGASSQPPCKLDTPSHPCRDGVAIAHILIHVDIGRPCRNLASLRLCGASLCSLASLLHRSAMGKMAKKVLVVEPCRGTVPGPCLGSPK